MILKNWEQYILPDKPGVYSFYLNEEILYIGKATSLKTRTRSYFDNDILRERGLHIANMVTLANGLKWQETRSVLEAELLENELIKKHKPKFNTISKDDKSYFVLVITEEDFPRVVLVRNKDIDKENNLVLRSKFLGNIKKEIVKVGKTFGPYTSGQHAKDSLKLIRRLFPFRDKCTPYDPKHPHKKNPCFSYQIGLCPGVCVGVCSKKMYAKQISRLVQFLEGNGEELRRDIEKEMLSLAKDEKFEEAQKNRDLLFALDHIRDAHLIQKEWSGEEVRIEAYDIAHISGQNRVGAMTVFQNGVLAKHEYKKFKISTEKNDDLDGLKELFARRIKHLDWGVPDIVVLDGDERHINVVENILNEQKIENIVVLAVTKDKSHKANKIVGGRLVTKEIIEKYKSEIILVNAEVHRFALNYHKLLRKKRFLS